MSFFSRLVGKSSSSEGGSPGVNPSTGKPLTMKEQCRHWTRDLTKQHRLLERQKNDILREENKLKLSIKQSARKNDINSVKVMAKSIVQSKNAYNKLTESQTRINSIIYQLQSMQATNTVVGQMSQSTTIMTQMSQLMNVAEIRETTQNMQKEMVSRNYKHDYLSTYVLTLRFILILLFRCVLVLLMIW